MPRYIDADMLTTWFEADSRGDYFGGDYVRGIIAETPTADVRENVKSEWVSTGTNKSGYEEVRCKKCGLLSYWCSRFCPNCGSLMRG